MALTIDDAINALQQIRHVHGGQRVLKIDIADQYGGSTVDDIRYRPPRSVKGPEEAWGYVVISNRKVSRRI